MKSRLCRLSLVILVTLFGFFAVAENLGDLSIEELLVQPRFTAQEPSKGYFDISKSQISFEWVKQGGLSAVVRLGSQELIGIPQFLEADVNKQLGLFEAYGQFRGVYGDLRMGLVPTGFSIEGSTRQSQLMLPRSLLYRQRLSLLRDYGVSFFTQFSGWSTLTTIHNGEGGESKDGKTWVTMNWEWSDREFFKWRVSATAGAVSPLAMQNTTSTLAGLDKTKEVFWRLGTVSMEWKPHNWYSLFEFYYGEKEQEQEVVKFAAGHIDLAYRFNKKWQVYLRWDQLEPNGNVEDDQVSEYSMGMAYIGEHENSRWLFLGTVVEEEGAPVNDNRFLMEWRLTPLSN